MLVNFEQNINFETTQRCYAFWQKGGFQNHFWQSVDAILEDVSVVKTIVSCWTIYFQNTIFQCSKQYGSPTRVTRLKVEPNMAGPISIKDSDSQGVFFKHSLSPLLD